MKKSTENKIKKISKARIWPTILGSFFTVFILFLVADVFVMAYLGSVCSIKFSDMGKEVQAVATYFDSDTNQSGLVRYQTVANLLPNLSGIMYLDNDMNYISSYGKEEIDFDNFTLLQGFAIGDEKNISVYIPTGLENVVTVDEKDNNVEIDVDELFRNPQVSFNAEYLSAVERGEWQKEEVSGFDIIFLCDKEENGFLAIDYRFSLCTEDYLAAVIVLGIVCFLIIIMLFLHIASTIRQVRDKKRAYDALFTDIITGGKNSAAFYKRADELIKKNRGKRKYALIQIRLEKYKGFISCYGSAWTEKLADSLHDKIRRSVEKKETFARIENADFGLLLKYETEEELETRVRKLIDKLSSLNGQKLYFNAGICICTSRRANSKDLYNNASIARSTVKDENSCEIKWFTDALSEAQKWERKVEDEMEKALKEGQFEMYLQPKYTTKAEVVGGAEALVRWNHPTDGLIPPGKFIPIFEKDGFILQLDDFMIGELARQQAKWISEGKAVFPISVNVSRAHFMMENLADHIKDIVDQYNVPHKYIELELTESAFFDDKKTLIDIVAKMREYGFPVSMDDFGAGYSSLNSLKEIPLDVVKLDADFFRGEGNDERGKIIVSETIELAKHLGMHIVAEGIETREQVDFLADRKCDLIQGYYFAKPMRVSDFEQKAFGILSAE